MRVILHTFLALNLFFSVAALAEPSGGSPSTPMPKPAPKKVNPTSEVNTVVPPKKTVVPKLVVPKETPKAAAEPVNAGEPVKAEAPAKEIVDPPAKASVAAGADITLTNAGLITLETVLKNVLTNNGQIQEAAQDIEIARAQLERAKAAILPKASAIAIAAPIFEEKGDALHSTSNWNKWGPLLKGGVEIVQPLYSFGMLSSYRRAAEGQIDARTELADVKRNEVLMTAKEMYYGFHMASDLEKLVDDLASFLTEAVDTAEEQLKDKKKKGSVKPHDVYRLKTALYDLQQKKLYAKAARQTAERAVAWVAGMNFANLPDRSLIPEKYKKPTLEECVKTAKAKRPEFRALTRGQEARLALADAKRAQSYPILFVGAFGAANWSPVRERQSSIFANDPFNSVLGGVGLGLKFDLEFGRHSAEAQEERAEAAKLKATESYAAPGIELQVKKAYWELEQAIEGLQVAETRRAAAKKWFVSSAMGWSIGITPAKDLMEALEGNGLARKNYIETVYSLNMALGRLSQAIGQEVTELTYR